MGDPKSTKLALEPKWAQFAYVWLGKCSAKSVSGRLVKHRKSASGEHMLLNTTAPMGPTLDPDYIWIVFCSGATSRKKAHF